MSRGWKIVTRSLSAVGWAFLALVAGGLIGAVTSSGWVGLVLGSAGLLAVVALLPRVGGRGWHGGGRLLMVTVLLIGLAVLVASVRNTPLGGGHVPWLGLGLAVAALVASFVGLRHRGPPRVWWGLVLLAAAVSVGVGMDGFGAFRTEAVAIANGDVHLAGTLLLPRGEGPFPAVLFVHGAGPELGLESHHMADRMAREGMATLTWDKRGSGRSIGGSPRDDFAQLASDVVVWVEMLRRRPDIDGERIALWGWSEGAWVAPLAAEGLGDVAALALISPGVEFGETYYFELGWRMRNDGLSQTDVERAIELRREINAYYRTGVGRGPVMADLQAVQGEAWYVAALEVGLLPTLDGVTAPNDPETVAWLRLQDFTLLTSLGEFEGPVLAAFGLQDQCNPAAAGADIIEDALVTAGNDHRILRYPEAGHVILVWLSGELSCGVGIPPPSYPSEFVETTAGWLANRLAGPTGTDSSSS